MGKHRWWWISGALIAWAASAQAELGASLRIAPNQRQSTTELMGADNQRMQKDMALHPAQFAIMQGQALWEKEPPNQQASCAGCHQNPGSLRDVAASYPKLDRGQLTTLEDRINLCRSWHQKQPPYAPESTELLALSALLGLQSRGAGLRIDLTPATRQQAERGEQLFNTRMGQINLSCAHCHEERAGLLLGGVVIPQGHPTGYPIYRLEWQSMGSLQRRLRNCMIGMRAAPYEFGAEELKQLELFLQFRARGMVVETPAIRP